MTALSVACSAAAPTGFERALLTLSLRLNDLATTRMQRRARVALRTEQRAAAVDAQRDRVVSVRAGMLPR
jgi:hypothetical protein